MTSSPVPTWYQSHELLLIWLMVLLPIWVQNWRYSLGPLSYVRALVQAVVGFIGFVVVLFALQWALGAIFGPITMGGPVWFPLYAVVGLAVGYLTWQYYYGRRLAPDALKRGAVVVDGSREVAATARMRREHGDAILTLAGIWVDPADEAKHFKLIGTTGSGKSTAIRELIDRALARGDRAVIADPDGGYLASFYDSARGDVILNPFDARSARWDLFA